MDNVVSVFTHPWFNRVWVLREVGLAKKAVFTYGSSTIDFAEVVDFVQEWASTRSPSPGVFFRSGHIADLFGYVWSSYVKNSKTSWFRSALILRTLFQRSMKSAKFDFLDVLFRAGQIQKATDHRDFVYAFLRHPLARSGDGELLVKAYYKRGLSELGFCLFFGLSARSLRFLGLVWHNLPDQIASGPSWWPQSDARLAWAINGRYDASRMLDPTSLDRLSLGLELYVIDSIDT